MSWRTLPPSEKVEAADWIRKRLHPFKAYEVGSVIPDGFAAYARIFHPASASRDWRPEEVRWSTVAAWAGRVVHPLMQFHSIAAPAATGHADGPEPWNGEPRLGVLSKAQSGALTRLLARFTSTPDACWFCIWEGYGYFTPGAFAPLKEGPSPRPARWRLKGRFPRPKGNLPERKRVSLPHRNYLLYRGPIGEAEGWEDGPNLWWPDDRAWCVASEIDHPYSYVGGPQQLIDEILGNAEIESLPATPKDGILYSSDKINV